MFFSAELLAKRDSGFGLLWLAATLGSKSTFRKLPKQSVLTADINQLCELIAEPAEPLALRLSSNLMVGVARVYKVKQDLFMADVTTCVSVLKKVMKELQTTEATDARLQLPNPIVRASAITLAQISQPDVVLAYDAFITDWDTYLKIGDDDAEDDDDRDYSVKNKQSRPRKPKVKNGPGIETVRAELCTLAENHEHLLSASFNMSFSDNSGGNFPMSIEDEYDFGNNFLPVGDVFDIDALGEELSRELTQAWEQPSQLNQEEQAEAIFDDRSMLMDLDGPLNLEIDDQPPSSLTPPRPATIISAPHALEINRGMDRSSFAADALIGETYLSILDLPPSPGTSFSRQFLSQDNQAIENGAMEVRPDSTARGKRARLLLDSRTELTDEEIKVARACYLKDQTSLRRELFHKKLDKECNKVVEDLVWGAPNGVQAPALKAFWETNFKNRIETRLSILRSGFIDDFPVVKRRRISLEDKSGETLADVDERPLEHEFGESVVMDPYEIEFMQPEIETGHRPSSEEPGRARQNSQPPFQVDGGQFEYGGNQLAEESQRSSLFPWDHAAASSSSVVGFPLPGSDQPRFESVDVRVRRSRSRRSSSLAPSRQGSGLVGGDTPPIATVRSLNLEDYEFDVAEDHVESEHHVSQASDTNLATLERNTFNFLEYTKMQQRARTDPFLGLSFDDVVPPQSSTRHVAAAAFYHCLVLATKDLLRLKQPEPYNAISISTK